MWRLESFDVKLILFKLLYSRWRLLPQAAKALFTAVRVSYYDFEILVLNFLDLVLVRSVWFH